MANNTNLRPLVSIIINCFNGQRFLSDALTSIVNQTYKNWEIIFWDNQSKDNSKKIFFSFKDKRFKYFYANKHTVLYEARNLAIKKAKGKYISFLDADDLWCKNKLESSLKVLDSDSSVGMTCGNYRRLMPNGGLTRPFYTGSIDIGFDSLLKVNYVASGSVTMRRDVAERAGLFDERFRVCEDYALWLSVSKFAKIYYIFILTGQHILGEIISIY